MEALLARVANRVRLSIGRAILRAVTDTSTLQQLQVELLAGEVRDGCERFQQYGYTSHPLPGAECIALAVGGDRNHVVVIAADDRRFRVKSLKPGEVAIYTDEGDSILLGRDRKIVVTAGTSVTVDSPQVNFTGDVHVVGTVTAGGDVVAGGISLKTHTHQEQGDFALVSAPQ